MHLNTAQRQFNFLYLLVGLLLLFITVPVMQAFSNESARLIMLSILAIALIVSIWSFLGFRKTFTTGIAFSILTLGTAVVAVITENILLDYLVLGLNISFWLIAVWIAGPAVFGPGVVDLNRIIGSVCLYLIAGFAWAYFYVFHNILVPDAFKGLTSTYLSEQLPELTYFSFVTLSTLGYGDITPVTPLAKAMTNVEAIFGQFYMAILVAALVGKYISKQIDVRNK